MRKSKSKLIIVIIVILVIVLGGAYLYFTTDLFKTNQQLFFKYLAKNGEVIKQISSNNEDTFVENTTKNKHTTEALMTFNVESNDTQIADQSIPAGNFSIKYSAKEDPKNNRKSSETTLKYLTTDLFTLKYIRNNDLYALKSDEVVNKYLAFDNNNLKDFAKKLGIQDTEAIPNKFQPVNYEELFSITEEQQKAILQKYLGVINTQIPSDKYKSEKNVAIIVNDASVNATAYSIELTQDEVIDLLSTVLETLKLDDETLEIAIEKIKIVDAENTLTINDLKDIIQNKIDDLNNAQTIAGENIKITVYASNGELIRTQIAGGDDIISFDTDKNDTSSRVIISFEKENEVLEENNRENNYSSDLEKMIHEANQLASELERKKTRVEKVELAKQIHGNQSTMIAIVTLKNGDETLKISAQSKTIIGDNVENNTIINVNIADNTYITSNINTTKVSAENIEVEELTKENSATINNFTPQYISSLSQAIVNRLQSLFVKKIEIINAQINTQNTNNEQNNNMLIQDNDTQNNNTLNNNTQNNNTQLQGNNVINNSVMDNNNTIENNTII